MKLAVRSNYPVGAVTCALLYGIIAVVVASLMIYLNPYEILHADDEVRVARGQEPLYEKYTLVYWTLERVLYCLAIPIPLLLGGLLALIRPRLGGWVYLAGALASVAALLSIISSTSTPGMAGAMAGIAAVLFFLIITLPMLALSWMLLRKKTPNIEAVQLPS